MPDIFSKIHNSEHETLGSNMRGEYGEAIVRLAYVQNGWRVSTAADHYPYDLVIERHGVLRRVQVKTVRGAWVVNFKASDDFDTAAIVRGDGSIYAIPRSDMGFSSAGRDLSRSKFALTKRYREKYKIGTFAPIEFEDHVIVT